MGGDGGSIPRRIEQVKLKKGAINEADPDRKKADMASMCALSHHPLAKPVVICDLGNLFSKTSVIEFLLEKKNACHAYNHIKSLKHVYETKASFLDEQKGSDESTQTPIICPVTNIIFNGSRPFVFMKKCKCIVSENAIKRLGTGDKCVACEAPLPDSDGDPYQNYIPLLPEETVKDALRERLFEIREREHKEKQAKKAEKKAAKEAKSAAVRAQAAAALAKAEAEAAPLTKEEEKQKRKLEKKRKRMLDKQEAAKKAKATVTAATTEDPRAKTDERFKSKVFASMFLKTGEEDASMRKEFMSGISTKALSQMSYL